MPGIFLIMSLIQTPGMHHASLPAYGALLFPKRESPTTITLLTILTEALLRYGVDCLTLDNLLGCTIHHILIYLSLTFQSLKPRDSWRIEVDRERVFLQCWAGARFHSFPSLRCPFSAQWWQMLSILLYFLLSFSSSHKERNKCVLCILCNSTAPTFNKVVNTVIACAIPSYRKIEISGKCI